MSFSTKKTEIKTVGDMKRYLAQFPDEVGIVIPNFCAKNGWCHPFVYFDGNYSDVWCLGDKAKIIWNGHEVWVSQICIENENENIPPTVL